MKLLAAVMLLLFSHAASMAKEATQVNPIVGKWRWGKHLLAEFTADGLAKAKGYTGKWKESETSTIERKYTVSWNDGIIVDDLTLEKNGARIRGKNSKGEKFTAEKIPAESTAAAKPEGANPAAPKTAAVE
jgi:hypothetical protein